MKFSDFDYEEDLAIDPDALDVEWLDHPARFMRYAEACAKAKKKLDESHERVKVVRSKLVKRIKEQEGGTAQEIEAKYRNSPRHKKAKQAMINAEYQFNVLSNAVSAMHARRSALENLVRLHGQSYFAGPQEPRDLSLEFGKQAREVRRKEREERMRGRSTRTKPAGRSKRTK